MTLAFGGGNAQNITQNAGTIAALVEVNKSGDTATLLTNLAVDENMTIMAGTLSTGGFNITGAAGKTFQVDNGAFFDMIGSSAYPATFGTYTYGATSTVRYLQSTATTITNTNYGHLEIKPVDSMDDVLRLALRLKDPNKLFKKTVPSVVELEQTSKADFPQGDVGKKLPPREVPSVTH